MFRDTPNRTVTVAEATWLAAAVSVPDEHVAHYRLYPWVVIYDEFLKKHCQHLPRTHKATRAAMQHVKNHLSAAKSPINIIFEQIRDPILIQDTLDEYGVRCHGGMVIGNGKIDGMFTKRAVRKNAITTHNSRVAQQREIRPYTDSDRYGQALVAFAKEVLQLITSVHIGLEKALAVLGQATGRDHGEN